MPIKADDSNQLMLGGARTHHAPRRGKIIARWRVGRGLAGASVLLQEVGRHVQGPVVASNWETAALLNNRQSRRAANTSRKNLNYHQGATRWA